MSPPEITISWTQLRVHADCRQKSYLLRQRKRRPTANIRSYFPGRVVDAAMREWLADPQHPPAGMQQRVPALMEELAERSRATGDGILRWSSASDQAQATELCTRLVANLEPILRQRVLPYPFQTAVRFRTPVVVPFVDHASSAVINLAGELDLLVNETTDSYAVWDLKGTTNEEYWRHTVGQLVFYDVALQAQHGQPPARTGLLQPACQQQVMEFVIDSGNRRQMWSAILRMAADIWRGNATCTDDPDTCRWCEVSHACPRYSRLATPARGSR